jgi:trimethylamine:corrinoid methyltransferase-like protein
LSAAGIVGAGSLDMRTLHTLFGAPEARLANIAVHHVGERLYGIKMHICMDYIDRKRPGIQATFEKTMLMAVWPFIGSAWFRVGGGLLQGGKAYSPVQHLLDIEMRKCWERFAAGFDVNDVTLAVDLVDSVARRRGATFLDTDHTLEHYASEQWYPRWFDRRAWQGDAVEEASERKMLEEIDRYWKDAVARYQRPELDEKKLAEARQVLQNAEREMKNVSLAV